MAKVTVSEQVLFKDCAIDSMLCAVKSYAGEMQKIESPSIMFYSPTLLVMAS